MTGWRVIWIVRNGEGKLTPQAGATGYHGRDLPRPADAVGQATGCPPGAMMLDVDQYVKDGVAKTGADTLRGLEAQLGPLPPTWKITSRGPDDPGGKLLFRVPPDVILKGSAGKDVEVIQRHHRFAWAPGTVHPTTGRLSAVYDRHGGAGELPGIESLPWLPTAWLDYLRAGDRDMVPGSAELPADDGRCPVAAAHVEAQDFSGASPRGERANRVANYLRRMDAEGHQVGRVTDEVIGLLPNTSEADFAGMWATAPVPADIVHRVRDCAAGRCLEEPAQPGQVPGAVAPDRAPAVLADEQAALDWAREQDPAQFFGGKDGLLAVALARAVARMGPLAMGADNRMWKYQHGVYLPDPNVVRTRAALLLKDSYRRSHCAAAEDVTASWAPVITSDPVERYVNVANGLLDWRTGELSPHAPDVLSTVQLAVPYDPGATAPHFARWLAEVVPPDCVTLVLELIGYLAYSGNPLHTAVMLAGDGRNGKGTLLRVILGILGKANVTSVSLHDLTGTRFATASLFGKLANISGDIDGTYLESTATFKAVTGNDQISAEHKGRDRFDFTPWAVPVFSANKVPASADTTAGYLSRWLVVPFPNSFEGREDRTVEARLHAELPGILAAGLRELPRLLARGQFSLGDSAREAKADFARHVDQVRNWVHECCEHGDYPLANRTGLYRADQAWAWRDGGKPIKAGEFYTRLAAAGVAPGAENGVRGFRGIRVTDDAVGAGAWPA